MTLDFPTLAFLAFAATAAASALATITARNPVHAALWLVLTFFSVACTWIVGGAEFLGIALVLVYVGAVMVLFLFVVMMLDVNVAAMRAGFIRYLPVGVAVAVIMAVELALVVGPRHFGLAQYAAPAAKAADYSNTESLGMALYTAHLYPFEIAGAILLVAIIAAIRLTLRRRPDTRYLDPSKQVHVRRGDRVRLVKMAPEQRLEHK